MFTQNETSFTSVSKLQRSWVPVEARQAWKNLRICWVEDAGTLWVREAPSESLSREMLVFQQMEKDMNSFFNKKQNGHSYLQFSARAGDVSLS
ncbi:hypothetical protein Hamer_G018895 [Homarus americanus]|uniref:Uncharacterized protein n=1 Tax=Homarus americanus TaxID=6706 RepID=A0A8J5N5H2_HOMAM|nr:hypothetical protein Hamer_G018895 [Homarus americanus]